MGCFPAIKTYKCLYNATSQNTRPNPVIAYSEYDLIWIKVIKKCCLHSSVSLHFYTKTSGGMQVFF